MAAVELEPSSSMKTPTLGSAGIVSDADFFAAHFGESCRDDGVLDSGYANFGEHGNDNVDFGTPAMPEKLTPPPSAKLPPSDWFRHSEQEQTQKQDSAYPAPLLTTLDAPTYSDAYVRFEHGQWTPPDDASTHDAQFAMPAEQQAPYIKQEDEDVVKASLAERKRNSTYSTKEAPPSATKKRRARKSVSIPLTSGPPGDPVEEEKRSKFLERNRVAASKCRQKKKEWTQGLEARARDLQASNIQYRALASSLREEVLWLKGEMLKHTDCGCAHVREYLAREAENIASGNTRTANTPASRASYSVSHDDAALLPQAQESQLTAHTRLSPEHAGTSTASQFCYENDMSLDAADSLSATTDDEYMAEQ